MGQNLPYRMGEAALVGAVGPMAAVTGRVPDWYGERPALGDPFQQVHEVQVGSRVTCFAAL